MASSAEVSSSCTAALVSAWVVFKASMSLHVNQLPELARNPAVRLNTDGRVHRREHDAPDGLLDRAIRESLFGTVWRRAHGFKKNWQMMCL